MPAALDDLMESASHALAELDYARCETLCVEALGKAREASDWVTYRRVLMPLLECRRQKRQAAIDGLIQLGTPEKSAGPEALCADLACGCVLVTWPNTAADAAAVDAYARQSQRAIEVLFADNPAEDATWRIVSFASPSIGVELPGPQRDWIGQRINPQTTPPPTPAHWFMQASEALGNAALASIDEPVGTLGRLLALEQALSAVGDHEILHQRLADAAKALHEAQP